MSMSINVISMECISSYECATSISISIVGIEVISEKGICMSIADGGICMLLILLLKLLILIILHCGISGRTMMRIMAMVSMVIGIGIINGIRVTKIGIKLPLFFSLFIQIRSMMLFEERQ